MNQDLGFLIKIVCEYFDIKSVNNMEKSLNKIIAIDYGRTISKF